MGEIKCLSLLIMAENFKIFYYDTGQLSGVDVRDMKSFANSSIVYNPVYYRVFSTKV